MEVCLGVAEKILIFKQTSKNKMKQQKNPYISFQARSISLFPFPIKE